MMNEDKIKVKVFKTRKNQTYCYECGHNGSIILGITDWTEVSRVEYVKLNEAVSGANVFDKKYNHFVIIDESNEQGFEDIFKKAQDYTKSVKEEQAQWEKRAKRAKASMKKRKADAELRKFEELKKKLGK